MRVQFCNWFCEAVCSGEICLLTGYFTNETWFYVNTGNNRYWLAKKSGMALSQYYFSKPV